MTRGEKGILLFLADPSRAKTKTSILFFISSLISAVPMAPVAPVIIARFITTPVLAKH